MKKMVTWDEARLFCQSYGGGLAGMSSSDTETLLSSKVNSNKNSANLKLWLNYRHKAEEETEIFDDFTFTANTSASAGKTFSDLGRKLTDNRVKRDASEDTCMTFSLDRNKERPQTVEYELVGCSRELGWICRFPVLKGFSEDEPKGQSLDSDRKNKSVSIQPRAVRSTTLMTNGSTLLTSTKSSVSTADVNMGFTFPSKIFQPVPISKITPIPTFTLDFSKLTMPPRITGIPEISKRTFFPNFENQRTFPRKGLDGKSTTPVPIEKDKAECVQTIANGQTWQKAQVGTFVAHACDNGKWTSPLDDYVINAVRNGVVQETPEQVALFDNSAAKYPYGKLDTVT